MLVISEMKYRSCCQDISTENNHQLLSFLALNLHLRTDRALNLLRNTILLQRYDNESDQDNGIKPHER